MFAVIALSARSAYTKTLKYCEVILTLFPGFRLTSSLPV
jgi:hypothetical protein